jgi:GTP pyrophosphokinase
MVLSQRFEEALVFATHLHREQARKGSNTPPPYVGHLLSVAGIALDYGATEEEAIAALLHDAVEDQGGSATKEAIRERFGDQVVAIVMGCSDAEGEPKPPWQGRKEAYLARLPHESASVRLVSAADKLHNARSILMDYRRLGEALWSRFKGDKEGTLWYLRSLVSVFLSAGSAPLIDELDRVVTELETASSPPF